MVSQTADDPPCRGRQFRAQNEALSAEAPFHIRHLSRMRVDARVAPDTTCEGSSLIEEMDDVIRARPALTAAVSHMFPVYLVTDVPGCSKRTQPELRRTTTSDKQHEARNVTDDQRRPREDRDVPLSRHV
jgi:hypothetical protein